MSAVGLASLTTVMVLLVVVAFGPDLWRAAARVHGDRRARRLERARASQRVEDPGWLLRAERRAERQILQTLGPEAFEAYRALGFLYWFGSGRRKGYLIYPRTSIVSFDPDRGEPLDEYATPAGANPGEPAGDAADAFAKWQALTADEGSIASASNMHLLGRDVDPARVRRDLIRLSDWTAGRPDGDPESNVESLGRPDHRDGGWTIPS